MAQKFEGAVPPDSPLLELTDAATLGDPRDIPPPHHRQDVRLELRPYQTEAVEAVEAALHEVSGALLVSPTGAGKTVIFTELTRRYEAAGKRTFVLVHRRELTKQASDKLWATGISHGVIQAGFDPRPW